ncbi:HesA/MoeB/ThiF family protein [Legionella cardiaca]|uniref:HesA/MoeB/ThiF family protein n=2 Tax=Legionella cardiaca TaxID=1071983 RepID=A0ABY8AVM9_9GAMM|nr:HesA/MoeB/ThiF family protein [Legionella cardiaca]WED44633.1 HesA/MoeB/ThiF family protein [Legionella cardiaca]
MSFVTEELTRYSQQIKLPEVGLSGQEKLKNTRVLCIGVGGLGSSLSLYLAAAGVGTLGIVDDDVVELSNLHRQILYHSLQINQPKAFAAKEQLVALNPTIQVNAYPERLTQQNAAALIKQYDIIVDGSDNFYTRYLAHDYCFALNKPYIYASASQFQGYSSIFYGKQGPCFHCLFPKESTRQVIPNCGIGGVLGTLPGILGMIQATEIIKWVLKIGDSLERRLLIVDLLKMTFKEVNLIQNPDCQLCVHHQFFSENKVESFACQYSNHKDYGITYEKLPEFLQRNAMLVDVRTLEEHQKKNIGGKLIPLTELPQRLHELNPEQMIILYCFSGQRSMAALNMLLERGVNSVKYLINGIANL